jgi:hypothetical protein
MNSKLTPLDDKLRQLIGDLSRHIGGDSQAIDPIVKNFMADLFGEIEKAIRAERDKPISATAAQFWGTVKEAIEQIKRRAIET